MDTPKILVIDSDPKNLQILKESLEFSNFKVVTINNGIDAMGIIQSQIPDLIVCEVDIPGINGFELHERLQNIPSVASIPVIFLTNRRNLEDQKKGLKAGIKDYMIKPLHVKEVIARLQMILRRIDRVKNAVSESTRNVVGRLEEKSVEDLVESYGAERRTGILALYDKNNLNGEIYFRDGTVVNARLGNYKAEKAVYQMLPWKHGHFVMTFKEINVDDEITVSNLGLLLQGFKRLQDREKYIAQLPSMEAIFVKTAIFEQILKKKSISTDALKFIHLFDGKRTISNIIAESIYDDINTLEKITKLYQQGFIRTVSDRSDIQFISEKQLVSEAKEQSFEEKQELETIEFPHFQFSDIKQPLVADENLSKEVNSKITVEEEFVREKTEPPDNKIEESEVEPLTFESENKSTPEIHSVNGKIKREEAPIHENTPSELATICDELFNGNTSLKGQLVILSSDNLCRKELLAALSNGHVSAKPISGSSESIELVRIATSMQHTLEILGLSTERKYLQMLDQMSSILMGYILLVAADNSSNLGYLGYLLNSLKQKFTVPHIVAVHYPSQNKPIPLDIIRYHLRIDAKEQLVEIDIQDFDSIKHLLKQLKAPEYR